MFCKIDGKKKIKEWTGEYVEDTGEKEYRLVCPANPCEHDGHNYVFDRDTPFLVAVFNSEWVCSRCGKRLRYTD